MDDERVQEALFQLEGPDEDGCVWACSPDGRDIWWSDVIAGQSAETDINDALQTAREGILQRVGHEFRDDEAAGKRGIESHSHAMDIEFDLAPASLRSIHAHEFAR